VDKVVGTEDSVPIVVATDDRWTVAVEEEVEVDVVVEVAADEAGIKVVGTADATSDDTGSNVVAIADAVSEDTGINVVGTAVGPVVGPVPDWS
jgi:hypothetical protein